MVQGIAAVENPVQLSTLQYRAYLVARRQFQAPGALAALTPPHLEVMLHMSAVTLETIQRWIDKLRAIAQGGPLLRRMQAEMNALLHVRGSEAEWAARLQQARRFDGLRWGLRRQRTL
jgi:hypothetical protein